MYYTSQQTEIGFRLKLLFTQALDRKEKVGEEGIPRLQPHLRHEAREEGDRDDDDATSSFQSYIGGRGTA